MDKRTMVTELGPTVMTAVICVVVVTILNVEMRRHVACESSDGEEGEDSQMLQVCEGPDCASDGTVYGGATENYVTYSTVEIDSTSHAHVTVFTDAEVVSLHSNNYTDGETDASRGDDISVVSTRPGVTFASPYGYGVDCRASLPPNEHYQPNTSTIPIRETGDADAPISICTATLYAHNKLRHIHANTQPLAYDDTLAARAEQTAMRVADWLQVNNTEGDVEYEGEGSVYVSTYARDVSEAFVARHTVADAIFHWYKWSECGFDKFTGQYSSCSDVQRANMENILWRTTTGVGCGVAYRTISGTTNGTISGTTNGTIRGTTHIVTVIACKYHPTRVGRVLTNMPPPTLPDVQLRGSFDLEPQGECINKMASSDCTLYAICRLDNETDTGLMLRENFCRKDCLCS